MAEVRDRDAGRLVDLAGDPLKAIPKRRSLGTVKREMSAEELSSSPVAVQMLKNDNARLEREVGELKPWRDKFHEADKDCAIQTEKLKRSKAGDIISGSCFVLAGLSLGYARSLWDSQPNGLIALIFGGALLGAGIWAKAAMR